MNNELRPSVQGAKRFLGRSKQFTCCYVLSPSPRPSPSAIFLCKWYRTDIQNSSY